MGVVAVAFDEAAGAGEQGSDARVTVEEEWLDEGVLRRLSKQPVGEGVVDVVDRGGVGAVLDEELAVAGEGLVVKEPGGLFLRRDVGVDGTAAGRVVLELGVPCRVDRIAVGVRVGVLIDVDYSE